MHRACLGPVFCLATLPCHGQASLAAPPALAGKPTVEEVRKTMGIPSTDTIRGQQDTVGFASRPDQMAKVWERSGLPPLPEALATAPGAGVVGAICPHDDYLYAGRVYRQIIPRITAKTVVLVGVFHKHRRFGTRDLLVFEDYRAWRSPDGDIRISDLRGEVLSRLPATDRIQDAAMHDSEHSVEAIAYWLKHQRPELEILPILVPAASFPRLQELAARLGSSLTASLKQRGWTLGKDVAIVISSDGVHYGSDFNYTPYGAGGVGAYVQAADRDRALLRGPLAGPLAMEKAKVAFSTWVNPDRPDEYRMPWCGRFSIPFGLLLLNETARGLGLGVPVGFPIAFGTSVDAPEVPVKDLGLGATAPANLYHFVSYPGVVFALDR
ncbi:MAG: AmmeMemoRadiSam system protein B [Holophagaceae bacterium]|uniref:AmmeMemoRadiSam system protein B n=1 Tax=Candidatus Geothrix skivensis TaxID=2954439 RepID=A0A9D7SJS9_9BACT|nr:AmmeMemoRadiSam system protein B [Candidatus Geothrix skivensis]